MTVKTGEAVASLVGDAFAELQLSTVTVVVTGMYTVLVEHAAEALVALSE